MRKRLRLLVGTCAVVLALGLLTPGTIHGDGLGKWLKFLFTPQAGLGSAGLSCGWHDACKPPYNLGTALDFPAASSDAGDAVYFRSFGFKPSGGDEYVAFGTPFTVPGGICVETQVRIRDKETYDNLGWIQYMHTYKTSSADMLMYVNQYGRSNQALFAAMAKEPWNYAVPESQRETWDCYNALYWTGVHLHEYQVNGTDTIFLRDGGGCGGWYPCAPAGGGPYNPQNWGADWTRIFCIDDTDCDGWTDGQESYVGTDSWDACPDGSTDAAWPLDINNDRVVNIVGDVLRYVGRINATPGSPNWWQRLNLNGDGLINVTGDVLLYRDRINSSCTN